MEGIGSASNQDARLVASAGIVQCNLGSARVGRSIADGRILGTPSLPHLSRNPHQHGARKPPNEAADTPHRRLANARLAQWSGGPCETIGVSLARKLLVPLTRQFFHRVAVHIAVLVR